MANTHVPEPVGALAPWFDEHPSPMWFCDAANLKILAANQAALDRYQYTRAEFVGRSALELVPVAFTGAFKQACVAVDPGEKRQWQGCHLTREGRSIDVEVTSIPMEFQGVDARLIVVSESRKGNPPKASASSLSLMHQNEAQFMEAFSHAPIGMALVGMDGRWTAINDELCRLLGYTREELNGKTWLELTHPDDREVGIEMRSQLLRGAINSFNIEKRYLRKDGRSIWTFISASIVHDGDGKPLHLVVQIQDIDEIKRAREALTISEERYRLLVEASSEGVWQVDQNFCTTFANPRMAEMLGTTPEAMLGKSVLDYLEEDQKKLALQLIDRRRAGEPSMADLRFKHCNGQDVWVIISGNPLLDKQGQFCGSVGMVKDITSRKRLEQALIESEEKFRAIAESIDHVFWMADLHIRENHYVSPAYEKLWGRTLQSLRDNPRSFKESIHPDDRERVEFSLLRQRDGLPFDHEYRIVRPDGAIRWVHDRGFPIREKNGSVRKYVGTATDITSRKELELREKQTRTLLELIASDHDFKHVADAICNAACQALPNTGLVLIHDSNGREGHPYVEALSQPLSEWREALEATISSASALTMLSRGEDGIVLAGDCKLVSELQRKGMGWLRGEWIETGKTGKSRLLAAVLGKVDVEHNDLAELFEDFLRLLKMAFTRSETLGKLRRMNATLEDRVNARTRELKNRVEAMDCSPDGIAILEGDFFVYMNPAHARIYGYDDPAQLIGKKWQVLYDECEIKRIESEIFPVLAASGRWSGETSALLSDGSPITTEISLNITPSGDLVCSCRDATVRRQQTDALRKSEHLLSLVLEATEDGFWDWNVKTGVTAYSKRWKAMLGYTDDKASLSVSTWESLIHPDDKARVIAEKNEMLNGLRSSCRSEYRLRTQHGGWLWVEDRGRVVEWDVNGKAIRAVGAHTDITQRRQIQESLVGRTEELIRLNNALAEAAKARDQFLASMSHELRTPLTSILALSEVLQGTGYANLTEKQRAHLGNIEQSAHHLLELINDVLEMARLEAGQVKLEIAPCIAASVAQDALQMLLPQAQKKALTLKFDPGPEGLLVSADNRRLRQILINLLSNAVKFTPQGGKVNVCVRNSADNRHVEFVVADTGIGIPENQIPLLFDLFYQVDSSLSRQFEGSGLGLPIVKRFLELHSGDISVRSKVGEGSEFIVTLAKVGGNAGPSTAPSVALVEEQARLSDATGHGCQVLLVEDNELNRQTIDDFLTSQGFSVTPVSSGQLALQQLERDVPDVAIIDIQMPGMDGLELTQRIRRSPRAEIATLPVIALTALAMPGDRERCYDAGASSYMSKPFRLQELAGVIKDVTGTEVKSGARLSS